jgi:hypothetical protein
MKLNIRFTVTGFILLTIFITSCQKEINTSHTVNVNKPHAVTIFLTDDPVPVLDSVFIDLQKLEVKLEDDSLSNGGWVSLNIHPGVYNILRFRNGMDTLFASGTLPNAKIQKIRLTLGANNSVMKNGQVFPLNVHSNDREIIANVEPFNFDIVPPDQVLFWIDFDAGRSIQVDNSGPGNNNGYRLKGHIKLFSRSHSGRIEGKVLPAAANPLVMAINGTDTTTAIPDFQDGEYKIVGLHAGNYKVFFDGRNGYQDTTINNVVVRNREDTHLPLILLHQ